MKFHSSQYHSLLASSAMRFARAASSSVKTAFHCWLYSAVPLFMCSLVALCVTVYGIYSVQLQNAAVNECKAAVQRASPLSVAAKQDALEKKKLLLFLQENGRAVDQVIRDFEIYSEEKSILAALITLPGFAEYAPFHARYNSLTTKLIPMQCVDKKASKRSGLSLYTYSIDPPIKAGQCDISRLIRRIESPSFTGLCFISNLQITTVSDPYKHEAIQCSLQAQQISLA